jgi:hypothetical protein
MANISTYPIITPKSGDLIIGSETYDATDQNPTVGNPTRNFTVGSVLSSQMPNYITGTINKIPVFTTANAVGDSIITQVAGTAISISGNLTADDIDCSNIEAVNITAEGTTLLEGGTIVALPSFADDAAASSLAQGRLYQTDGTGAAPLNVAGIVMRKQ